MSEAIPAATLIAMRERVDRAPEVLMLRRHAALAFAGDAWVFPGGRVDPDDRLLAARIDMAAEPADRVARVAAIRETIEEAGLAIALDPLPGAAELATIRRGLADGIAFSRLLAERGMTLRLDALIPWARWQPPATVARRFDTYFYLTAVAGNAPVSADGGESIDIRWATPAAMLDRWEEGEAKMLLPTRANLARLQSHATFAAAARDAAATPVRLLQPTLERIDGGMAITIPEGHGYPPIRHDARRD